MAPGSYIFQQIFYNAQHFLLKRIGDITVINNEYIVLRNMAEKGGLMVVDSLSKAKKVTSHPLG